MKNIRILAAETPIDELLNTIQKILQTKTRTETIYRVGATPSTITRIRKGEREPSSDFILRVHDLTGLSVAEIRRIGRIEKFSF